MEYQSRTADTSGFFCCGITEPKNKLTPVPDPCGSAPTQRTQSGNRDAHENRTQPTYSEMFPRESEKELCHRWRGSARARATQSETVWPRRAGPGAFAEAFTRQIHKNDDTLQESIEVDDAPTLQHCKRQRCWRDHAKMAALRTKMLHATHGVCFMRASQGRAAQEP